MFAKSKAGGRSLQVPRMEKIRAEGSLKRQGNGTHRGSRNVMQQRPWIEINPNFPDSQDVSADWTRYQGDQARHTAWKPTKSSAKQKAYADVHRKSLPGLFSVQRRKHIQAQTDHKSRRDRIVDSGLSLHMMERSSQFTLSRGKRRGFKSKWSALTFT